MKKRRTQEDEESRKAFRTRADDETVGYLKEINQHLSILNDAEERELLVNNTFAGLEDLEKICLDAICTEILQGLAPLAGKESLLSLLGRINHGERLGVVATNPFGSHLLDSLLQAVSTKSLEGNEEAVIGIVDFVASYMEDFLSDKYATHVLRRLLAVLSGRDVVEICKSRKNPSKKEEPKGIVPEILFPELLKKLVDIVRAEEYQGTYLNGLISSHHSGPTLQAMIHACIPDGELLEGLILTLVGKSQDDGEIDQASLRRKMRSMVPSHMMELILQVASEEVRTKLFQLVAGDLPALAAHPIGNFSVQAMGRNATTSKQMAILVENLGPHFSELMKTNRDYVIISVLTAALACESHMKQVCNHLGEALKAMEMQKGGGEKDGKRAGMVEKLLCKGTQTQLGENSSSKLSPFGCIMLSTILKYPPEHNSAFVGGIARLNPTAVRQLAMDPGGVHVLETILQGPKYKAKTKKPILEKLEGVWGSIARTAAGARLVQNCFDHADAGLKEKITEAIAKSESQISNSKAGSILLSHLRILQFKNNRKSWRKEGFRSAQRTDDFLEAMEVDQPFVPVPASRIAGGEAEAPQQGGLGDGESPDVRAGEGNGGDDSTALGDRPTGMAGGGEEMEFHVDPDMFGADGNRVEGKEGNPSDGLGNDCAKKKKKKKRKEMEKEPAAAAAPTAKKKKKNKKKEKGKKSGAGRQEKPKEGPDIVVPSRKKKK